MALAQGGRFPGSGEGCVWVLDPDPRIHTLIRRFLEGHGLQTAIFTDVRSFLGEYRAGRASCLVLESRLPDGDGLAIQRRLNASGDLQPLVFLCENADVSTAVAAMKGGAADFLLKPCDPQPLLAAINEAISRSRRYLAFQHSTTIVRRLHELTAREREVLDLVVAGHSTKQISARLHRTHKTVEFHRQNIMRKLSATNVADLVRMVTTASHELSRMNGSNRRTAGENS